MPSFKNNLDRATKDLLQAVEHSSIWMTLGLNDIRARYHRSRLGVFWASLSILIFVSALGPVYANLFDVSVRDYTLHLMLGIILWGYMSSIILECCREYINAASYLSSFRLSYFTLLMRVVWRNLVVLSYQMLVFFAASIALGLPVNLTWMATPVALFVITINALWMGLLVSVFATRFRDLSELLNNVLRLVFFITPIMWMPDTNPDLKLVAEFNPFYHLIELFRAPLLTGELNPINWLVAGLIVVMGWLISFPIFAYYRARISFWL